MSFETVLNLAWLLLSAVLLLSFGFHPRSTSLRPSARLALLFLISVLAFPSISATDDLWNFQAIPESRSLLESGLPYAKKSTASLLTKLLEHLRGLAPAAQLTLALLLFFLAIVSALDVALPDEDLLQTAGRSPPSIASLT